MITDLTKEHPDRILWRFLLPMMISVMFQQFYNIADSMIAGKFAGESALAAVGASYPITIIYMAFAVGMNLGASVVISRLFGAGDKAGLRRAVSTAFISVFALSVVLSVFGYFCSGAMMRWIHTPEDIMADSVLYLKIYVYGLSFLLFYNVCTGIFTALGDSKTPLYFLIGSSLGNIFLDYLFVALGVVLQEVNLFTGTVLENIRYGRLDATDEECIAAAKLANADSFITRLPDGYNTMLTGNGASLSQGQRQLISIARAAVADPPAMILDEATSSIDTRTEALVQQGMDNLMEGRTVLVIAHRLSTIRNSKAIMVLDHGRIIERGDHDDLIAQKGTYYQLYTGAFELE